MTPKRSSVRHNPQPKMGALRLESARCQLLTELSIFEVHRHIGEVGRPGQSTLSQPPLSPSQARWMVGSKNLHVLCEIRLAPGKGIETRAHHHVLAHTPRCGLSQPILGESTP